MNEIMRIVWNALCETATFWRAINFVDYWCIFECINLFSRERQSHVQQVANAATA